MLTQEFYIRGPTDTDARGPFTVEQLVTLGETGGIDAETLFYDAATEQWAPIATSEKVKNLVFPEKKRLTVKPKQHVATLNVQQEEHRPITVQQMLAAAEGRTDDTKDKRAYMDDPGAVCAGRSGRGHADLPVQRHSFDPAAPRHVVMNLDFAGMLQHPLIFLGVLDSGMRDLARAGNGGDIPVCALSRRFRHRLPRFAVLASGPAGDGAVGRRRLRGPLLLHVVLSYLPVLMSAVLGLAGIGGLAYFVLMT